jgi:uncharacterized membrane protein
MGGAEQNIFVANLKCAENNVLLSTAFGGKLKSTIPQNCSICRASSPTAKTAF